MHARSFAMHATRAALGGFLAAVVVAVTACGGSSSPSSAANPASPPANQPSPAPVDGRAVLVRVTTSTGAPLPGVAVSLNGGFDGRSGHSDDAGWVRFDDIPAGEASVGSFASGFHGAYHRFAVASGADTDVTLILEQVTEATPVVLSSRAVAAGDGNSLTIDLDVALLDENGRAIATLTAADYQIIDSDCAFVPCGFDADFGRMPMGGYHARADDEAFRWQVSTLPTPPMAVGLLLDHSADMAAFDPAGLRFPALKAFLESTLPPDTVSLASYRGTGDGVDFTSHGPFTSDGARFVGAIEELTGREAGSNPFSCAVSDMLSLTAAQAPTGPDDPSPTVVVVTSGSAPGVAACAPEASLLPDALTLGIPVVSIGGGESGAAIAAGSGGAFVAVHQPLQFSVALRSLAPILGRTLDSNHLRFVLTPEGATPGVRVFRPGRQSVWAYLYVRIGPHTRVEIPLVMPVQ